MRGSAVGFRLLQAAGFGFLGLVGLGGFAAWAGPGRPVTLRLPEKVSVVGPLLSVGDVAVVEGDDGVKVDRVRRVAYGRAPTTDRPYTLNALSLRVALRKAGFEPSEFVVLEGTEQVTTESQVYPLKGLLPKILSRVAQDTGEDAANVVLEPSEGFSRSVTLPKGQVLSEIRPTTGRYDGTVLFTAVLSVDGRPFRTVPLRCNVKVERPAVVVVRRVERGQKLDRDDLTVRRVTQAQSGQDPLTNVESAVGRVASRNLATDDVVRLSDLVDPPVIRRGQEVVCRVKRGNVILEAQVKAQDDGKAGSVIRVLNLDSKLTLKARVIDENTVEAVAGPVGGAKLRSR